MVHRAVFLDRDGVLNKAIIRDDKPYPPASTDELLIPEEVYEATAKLKKLGFLLIGATNQPDVARQKISMQSVQEINQTLIANLPLDEIRVCYHDDEDHCLCR